MCFVCFAYIFSVCVVCMIVLFFIYEGRCYLFESMFLVSGGVICVLKCAFRGFVRRCGRRG